MGSLSLIIVLIIVVWVIVLAPMVMGNNKPIRRSGEGYEETRVLHAGGTAPVEGRRRPRLTPADVHRFDEEEPYEVVEAEAGSTAVSLLVEEDKKDADDRDSTVEGEVVVAPEEEPVEESAEEDTESLDEAGSDEDREDAEPAEEADQPYEIDETYVSPADYGYAEPSEPVRNIEPATTAEHEETEESVESEESEDLTEEEIEFARSRKGRGGWDPEREKASRADRFQRRQRTLLGLIIADVVAVVAAFVAGGWAWVLPALTIALTVWFMVTLRKVVRQERALHARRVRQLRRARLGVVSSESGSVRRRPGAVIVEMDDESPDFDELPAYYREAETLRAS
ncbi:gephyrin-like molybdotransferase receptor GlpR [uncultured Corynebacterium sp.]|uniref:divisome protein SepX/GlpR n=1 Tax=uncultured Corynebacterium sp. TaxID=159447 RepID=UPI002597B285|nr:gephyrin-like molybdotransferase receptor GlpR [uncultured Corynebacterium sp.]